jgi:hypothetical protein
MKRCSLFTFLGLLPLALSAASMQLEVKNMAGKAAANYPFKIYEVELFEGEEFALVPCLVDTLDARGQYTVKDLKPGTRYELGVGGRETGRFVFKDGATWQTRLSYIGAGDHLPDELSFYDISRDRPLTFGDLKGPMIYLEYWAVW